MGRYAGDRAFVEDIFKVAHASNRIQFARGTYEKEIYDRLRREASDKAHSSVR